METDRLQSACRVIDAVRRTLTGKLVIDDPGFEASTLDMLDLAEAAIRRQMPRPAKVFDDAFGYDRLCPACCGEVGGGAYCPSCGQRISDRVN